MATDPVVYCFCYDHNLATGGQKDTYKHVDALNSLGVRAFILHTQPEFRLTWFQNETPVVGLAQFRAQFRARHDIVVLPEDLGERIRSFPGRKVIFDKNIYYGFKSLPLRKEIDYPALDPDVLAILTVSEHNHEHLRFAYPFAQIHRIWPQIDTGLFRRIPLVDKQFRFVFPKKNLNQIATLFHMLHARNRFGLNNLSESTWVMAEGMSEHQIAALLTESLGFVFLSTEEGLGLAPLEAMASGCIVACYGSGPLRETIPSSGLFEYGNLLSLASFIESLSFLYPKRLEHFQKMVDDNERKVRLFSTIRHAESVSAAWKQILGSFAR